MATYKFVRKSVKTKKDTCTPILSENTVTADILSIFTEFPQGAMEQAPVIEPVTSPVGVRGEKADEMVTPAAVQEPWKEVESVSEEPFVEKTAESVDFISEEPEIEKAAEEILTSQEEVFFSGKQKTPVQSIQPEELKTVKIASVQDSFFLSDFPPSKSAQTTPLFVETLTKASLKESPNFDLSSLSKEKAGEMFTSAPSENTNTAPRDETVIFTPDNAKHAENQDLPFSTLKNFFLRQEEEVIPASISVPAEEPSSPPDETSKPEMSMEKPMQQSLETVTPETVCSQETITTEEIIPEEARQKKATGDFADLAMSKDEKNSVVDTFLKIYGTPSRFHKEAETLAKATPVFAPGEEAFTLPDKKLRPTLPKKESNPTPAMVTNSVAEIFSSDIYAEPADGTEEEDLKPKRKVVQEDQEAEFIRYGDEEYVSPDQTDDVSERIRSRGAKHLADFVFCAIYTLLLFYVESGILYRPKFLQPGTFGIFMLLVDSLFLILTTIQIFPLLQDGINAMKNRAASPNSITAVIFIACIIQLIINWLSPYNENMMLFSSLGALTAAVACLYNLFQAKQHYLTFRILSNGKTKLAAISPEEEENGEKHIYTVKRVSFINRFIEKANQPVRFHQNIGISMMVSFLFAAAFAILGGAESTQGGLARITSGANVFVIMLLLTTPLSSLFTMMIPYYRLSKKMNRTESALLSPNALDGLTASKRIYFSDADAFPTNGVKLASICTYGNHQIDRTLLYAAKIFKQCGGPLSRVFEESLSGAYPEIDSDLPTLNMQPGGICTEIDGKEILVGSKEFMVSYDFGYIKDDIDDTFENSMGRIMYMTIGDEIAAKFYIRYTLSNSFERILRFFGKEGIHTVIRTNDPNLNDDLLRKMLKYPFDTIHIEQLTCADTLLPVAECDLISTSSVSGLLRSFLLCTQLKQHIRWNNLIKTITILLGVILGIVMALNGSLTAISPLFIFIYQLVWILPVTIPSFMD